jgi:predicted DNA-binding WGR domain protein
MKKTELIYVGGGHRKFWTVETNGATMTCTWGRMGTVGQTKSWSYGSAAVAMSTARSKLQEKLAKGYVDASGSGTYVPAAPEVTDEEMAAARSTLEGVMAELEDG